MERREEDEVLEFGLLVIVTGLTVVLLATLVIVMLSNERAIASSAFLTVFCIVVLVGMAAVVFVLARRLMRFIAYR